MAKSTGVNVDGGSLSGKEESHKTGDAFAANRLENLLRSNTK